MQDDSEYVTVPLQFNADHCRQARLERGTAGSGVWCFNCRYRGL